jgi:hypothetical protein
MNEFHESAASTVTWHNGHARVIRIESVAELHYETHWGVGGTVVCPRKGCERCKYETPTDRLAFFGRDVERDPLLWVCLPADPWYEAPKLSGLPSLRGVVVELQKINRHFRIKPLGQTEVPEDYPIPTMAHAYRLLAKLHRLPIVRELEGESIQASFYHAAARKMKAICS